MNLAEDFRKYMRGMGIRAAGEIPCVATSNTEAQVRVIVRKDRAWAWFIVLFVGVGLLVTGLRRHPPMSAQNWLLAAGIWLGVIVMFLFTGRNLRPDFRDYRDPHLRIEVGPDEVVVVGPGGRDVRPYAAFASLSLLSRPNTRSTSFDGIGFDTIQGYVTLTNDYYQSGRKAAGAILKRMDELGVALTPYP